MAEIIQLVTTTDSEEHARQMGTTLVERRLAACVQIDGPLRSIYRWNGRLESAEEWRCTVKTTADHFDDVQQQIRSMHTYELPEIIATEIGNCSADYGQWVREQVEQQP